MGRGDGRSASRVVSVTRVLHAITMLELGGAQRNTLDTVRMLDRNRFAVGLACADSGELLPEARALRDVTRFELPSLRREVRPGADLAAYQALRGAVRQFRPDIVHTHSSKAGVLGRAAAAREGVPVIVHSIHGWGFGRHQSLAVRSAFLAAERWAARRTTHFIAVSAVNRDEGIRLGLFRPEQVSVIRSGIDLAAFRRPAAPSTIRTELDIPASAPLVVQVACFKPQKAPERFVRMAASLGEDHPAAHFVLVGDGELRSTLERLRERLGVRDRVHLPGWRRDVAGIMAEATVATLTSRFEGLPRAIVEARAAGVPVVAMAVDGVQEAIEDGVNGFLVPPGDEATMVARVGELLGRPELRVQFAARAGDGLEEFSRDRMVAAQETLYEELICRAGSF